MGAMGRLAACVVGGTALLFGALAVSAPAAAQSALLDPLATHVTLTHDGVVSDVSTQRVVRSGDTVATDMNGRAVITYPDGSTATLDAGSELTIEFVRTTAGDYVVRAQQTIGRVWYAVAQTIGSGGRYEVHSTAMASVIRAGSDSSVAVAADGTTTVTAIDGSVETSIGAGTAIAEAGASTTAGDRATSMPLEAPATTMAAPALTTVFASTDPTPNSSTWVLAPAPLYVLPMPLDTAIAHAGTKASVLTTGAMGTRMAVPGPVVPPSRPKK